MEKKAIRIGWGEEVIKLLLEALKEEMLVDEDGKGLEFGTLILEFIKN